MINGEGKIDLNNCELSLQFDSKLYRLRAFSETRCYLMISSEGAEVFCAVRDIEELRNSSEVPDFIQWLARGFAGVPARFKEAALK